jgi:H+/Cl- antiporter ClcA
MPLDIHRGFRRLSVLAAFFGCLVVGLERAIHWEQEWTQGDYVVAILIILVPTLVVLLLGWAIEGFQKSD